MYIALLWSDLPKLFKKPVKERFVYGTLVIAALYLNVAYVFHLDWPNLDDLVNISLLGPARRIVETFKLPS
jgi:hypothetical protein